MAIACSVERAPCFPLRMCSISSCTYSPAAVEGLFPSLIARLARVFVFLDGIAISFPALCLYCEEDSIMRSKARNKASGVSRKRHYWSAEVTRQRNALDLEARVFTQRDPRAIARSLKRSAERSRRRKAGAYQSAMSMLSFYINRAGRSLSAPQKKRLERAKKELRKLYGRSEARPS
jgi:Protein of unknown function (DUF3175)